MTGANDPIRRDEAVYCLPATDWNHPPDAPRRVAGSEHWHAGGADARARTYGAR